MGMSRDAYREQLISLLPPSDHLDLSEGSNFWLLFDAFAAEFARIDADVYQLIEEMDPRTLYNLLANQESEYGLPDPCTPAADQTLDKRRSNVLAKMIGAGGQSESYFIALADALGYSITISRFAVHDVNSDVSAPLYGTDWRFAFQVNAPPSTIRDATVNSGVDEALRTWGYQALECAINSDKPAETVAIFSYS